VLAEKNFFYFFWGGVGPNWGAKNRQKGPKAGFFFKNIEFFKKNFFPDLNLVYLAPQFF